MQTHVFLLVLFFSLNLLCGIYLHHRAREAYPDVPISWQEKTITAFVMLCAGSFLLVRSIIRDA